MANGKAKTRNAKKHLREETKMEIVQDYYLGALNKSHLTEKYGVGFAAENNKSALLDNKKQSIIINPST